MIRLLKLLFCLPFPLLFAGCHPNTPQAVVIRYTEDWYSGKLDAAQSYVVPEQRELIAKLALLRTEEDLKKLNNNKIAIEIQSEEPLTDSTMVMKCRVLINGEPRTNQYNLLKIKGKWHVSIY